MSQPSLPLNLPEEASLKKELGPALNELRQNGVWIGTSSWKYPGWLGRIYSASKYKTRACPPLPALLRREQAGSRGANRRGRVSDRKFKENCLAEYGETFSTVCVDAAFYQYPTEEQIAQLASQVPSVFKFTFKVTDHLTVPVWPHHPRHLKEAGNPNPHFLCAETFCRRYLNEVGKLGDRLGVMIFEFSPMRSEHIGSPRQFIERLDVFFRQLPKQYRYAVEVRNREFLNPEYLRVLSKNGVAHCFNSWTRMPSVAEQLKMPEIFTTNFAVCRFLLKPGRSYQEAVDRFKPYEKLKEIYEEGRSAARRLIAESQKRGIPVFAYFNNRLEGNSLETIQAVIGRKS